MEELFVYKRHGERNEMNDNDIYHTLKNGEQDDVALCYANSKEEAIEKFKKFFTVVENCVFSIKELYFIPSDNVCLLTPY